MPRIVDVRAHRVELGLRGVFRISYASLSSVKNVFVEVVLSDGTRGWGEASPAPRITWENVEGVVSYVASAAAELRGLELPRELGRALRIVHHAAPGFGSARAGLESALLDALARWMGAPAHVFFGGALRGGLVTDYTIPIPGPETLEEIRRGRGPLRDAFIEAVEYIVGKRDRPPEKSPIPLPPVNGFNILKVKLGTGDTTLDALLAETVYYAAEGRAVIRIDANQAWSRKQAINMVKRLEEALGSALELVEQPVPAPGFEDLKAVKEAVETPVAADESARSPQEAALLARMGAVDVVNIKVAKAGGPLEAAKIAALLEAHGLEAMWGCMIETELGISQALHPALASSVTRYVDLDSPLHLAPHSLLSNPPRYAPGTGGVALEPPEGPGLGPEPRLGGGEG